MTRINLAPGKQALRATQAEQRRRKIVHEVEMADLMRARHQLDDETAQLIFGKRGLLWN